MLYIIFMLIFVGLSVLGFVKYPFTADSNLVWIILGIVSSVAFIILLCIYILNKNKKQISWLQDRLEAWNSMSYNVKRAGDEAFNELPIGIMVFDDKYNIKWSNNYVSAIFNKKTDETLLSDLNQELYLKITSGEENITGFRIDKNDYDIIFRKDYKLLYFFNVTEREKIRKKYNDRTPAILFLSLENTESDLEAISDVYERAQIRGQYLQTITDWANSYNAFLQTQGDDLLIFTSQENLNKMVADKFSILNDIRRISSEKNLKITASIGVACWDIPFSDLGTYSQNAIELAEKRGGDQAVVNIQNQKVQYFGGKTNALEKKTKTEARVQAQTLRDLIVHSNNVLIVGHTSMDADSLGSAIGVLKMALASEANVRLVLDENLIDTTTAKLIEDLRMQNDECVNYFISVNKALKSMTDGTLVVSVDTQSIKISMSSEIILKAKMLAVIDHHRASDDSFDNAKYSYIEPYASSAVELITEMIEFYPAKVSLSALQATVMLTGVVVDSNDFTFRTGTRTFDVASTLREFGADMIKVRMILREEITRYNEIIRLVNKAEIVVDKFAIVRVPVGEKIDRIILSKVANELLNIDHVEASFAIGCIDPSSNNISISARSYENINVQVIMEEMGGGGHLNNAGCLVKSSTIDQVFEDLTTILKRDYTEIEGEKNMKVILSEDIKGRGVKGQTIEVATGYANYLLSNNKAVEATPQNLKKIQDAKEAEERQAKEYYDLMLKLKSEIDGKSINLHIKTGADGKIFGAITTKMIADQFEAQTGIKLDKKKISVEEINSVGIYTAEVKLHKDIIATIEVHISEKQN